MSDIFLSYAREDREFARTLAERLEAHGWSVWWDRRIRPGQDFHQLIEEQLDAARCIIVAWSKASIASQYVRDEAGEGLASRRLVPVLIDDVKAPLGYRHIQAANLVGWPLRDASDDFANLFDAIGALVPATQGRPAGSAVLVDVKRHSESGGPAAELGSNEPASVTASHPDETTSQPRRRHVNRTDTANTGQGPNHRTMPGDMTRLFVEWKAGRGDAGNELVSLTFAELRRLARSYLRRERAGHTLQVTALLNEVYLRLLPQGPRAADSREAFFRLMASEMRHRLVDHARRRLADKRGADLVGQPLDTAIAATATPPDTDVEATLDRLDRAIQALGDQHPRAARVVQLRFLAGLTTEETALEIGVSPVTIKREWVFARAWLAAAMAQSSFPE